MIYVYMYIMVNLYSEQNHAIPFPTPPPPRLAVFSPRLSSTSPEAPLSSLHTPLPIRFRIDASLRRTDDAPSGCPRSLPSAIFIALSFRPMGRPGHVINLIGCIPFLASITMLMIFSFCRLDIFRTPNFASRRPYAPPFHP